MALEGMQPTLRQVPPRAPRFSMQAVWVGFGLEKNQKTEEGCTRKASDQTYLKTELSSLDGSNVATGATADDEDVIRVGAGGEASCTGDGDEAGQGGRLQSLFEEERRNERIKGGRGTESAQTSSQTVPGSDGCYPHIGDCGVGGADGGLVDVIGNSPWWRRRAWSETRARRAWRFGCEVWCG